MPWAILFLLVKKVKTASNEYKIIDMGLMQRSAVKCHLQQSLVNRTKVKRVVFKYSDYIEVDGVSPPYIDNALYTFL